MRRWRPWAAGLAALAVACTSEPIESAAPDTVTEPVEVTTSSSLPPWAGDKITLFRPTWPEGYVGAQIAHDLLEELGYDVEPPDAHEVAPDLVYRQMAHGEGDVFLSGWMPGHRSWLEVSLRNGRTVGELLVVFTEPIIPAGGLQGLLVTKNWADRDGFTTVDELNADPKLVAKLDEDGDGRAQIIGCPEDWHCDDQINAMITFAGWSQIQQYTPGDFEDAFEQFVSEAREGRPAIAYVWSPSLHLGRAEVGLHTMWLSIEESSIVDDSDPLGWDGPVDFDQRPGYSALPETDCLSGPDGCQLGWRGNDIHVVANANWVADNPAAEALLAAMRFDYRQASQWILETGDDPSQADVEQVARGWIDANRDLVDQWLAEARRGG